MAYVSTTTAVVLAVASIAATAASTFISYQGQQAQARAAQQQANYRNQVLQNNAILAERQAKDAIKRGQAEEAKQRLKTRQLIGRQRAVQAANGVFVDQDSALDTTSDTAALGEVDALTIRNNAQREAIAHRAQANNFRADAALVSLEGANRASAARSAATSTLFSGIGSVASKWYQFDSEGVFS